MKNAEWWRVRLQIEECKMQIGMPFPRCGPQSEI
jgi:hypothetical protein